MRALSFRIGIVVRPLFFLFGMLAAHAAVAASAYCEAGILLSRVGEGIGADQFYRTEIFQVERADEATWKALRVQWIDYLKGIGKYREDNGERYGSPHYYHCAIAGLGEDKDDNALRTEYEYRLGNLRKNGFPPQIVQWAPKSPRAASGNPPPASPAKPVCEAEIRQIYGPNNAAGAASATNRHNKQLNGATLAEAQEALRKYEALQAGRQGAEAPMVGCLKTAWAQKVAQLSRSSARQADSRTPTQGADASVAKSGQGTQALAYGPNRSDCLKRGQTSDGYITYTNICKVPVAVGYCNVYAANGQRDGTVCQSRGSEFSRTKRTYVTQGLGLEPGATHRLAYRYATQSTFIVACIDGQPLIESFDSSQISAGSKAQTACWRFASRGR